MSALFAASTTFLLWVGIIFVPFGLLVGFAGWLIQLLLPSSTITPFRRVLVRGSLFFFGIIGVVAALNVAGTRATLAYGDSITEQEPVLSSPMSGVRHPDLKKAIQDQAPVLQYEVAKEREKLGEQGIIGYTTTYLMLVPLRTGISRAQEVSRQAVERWQHVLRPEVQRAAVSSLSAVFLLLAIIVAFMGIEVSVLVIRSWDAVQAHLRAKWRTYTWRPPQSSSGNEPPPKNEGGPPASSQPKAHSPDSAGRDNRRFKNLG